MAKAAVLIICALTAQGAAESRKQYCGDRLRNKLLSLCGGMYNKRWGPRETGIDMYEASREMQLQNQVQSQTLGKRTEPLSWRGVGVGRRRRGIVQECCHRGCTLRELSAYCLEEGV